MKAGWPVMKLGDVCQTGSGGTPLKAKKEYYENGTIPWLLSGEVSQGEIRSATTFITQKGLKNSSAKMFPKDTVLVAMYGATAGQVGILRFEAATNQAVCGILPSKHFVPEFLFYLMLSKKDQLVAQAAGNAQPNISQIKIKNTNVPIPPLPEQQRIVGILDEAFDGIATAKANAEKNLQNARALFESHLQSVFTQHGEGWVEKTLKEVASDFGRGKSKHRPRGDAKLLGGKYPLIQTGDISNADHWIVNYSQTYNEVGLAQSKLWPKGTVCIAIVGANVAETAILDFDACFPDSVIGIVVNKQVADNEYVEYLLQSFKAVLKEKGKGTARDNINIGTFENQTFPIPKLATQKEIVSQLDALCAETQRFESIYRQKLAALDALKKSLLDQAFTGVL